jgi:hypothetical protein
MEKFLEDSFLELGGDFVLVVGHDTRRCVLKYLRIFISRRFRV